MNYRHFSYRRTQLYTEILRGWVELSGDRPADWEKCQYHIEGDPAEPYPHVRHPNLLPAHSTEKVPAASFLLPPWNVPFPGGDRLHRGKAVDDMVTRADHLYPLRAKGAQLAHDLPLDL